MPVLRCQMPGQDVPGLQRPTRPRTRMTYNRTIVHGTVSGYIYRGCRCELCIQARRDYYGHKPLDVYNAEREAKHGTEARYTAPHNCRCDECKKAANEARRLRRLTGTVRTHNWSGYANGCRCDICREAQRIRTKEYRAKKRSPA